MKFCKSVNAFKSCELKRIVGFGYGYCLLGDVQKAIKYLKNGLKLQIDTGSKGFLSLHYICLSKVHCASQD